jgi:2-polyprenyl-6-methoxyphenol hydroxylase-like FAD-dependent oxidoreductase
MTQTLTTTCCIAGGGPAGMMLGFLLARAGIDVIVLEKHKDFLRDFRGDTVHPSTLEIFYELGLLDEFLRRRHQKLQSISGRIGDTLVHIADFSHTPTHCHFIALMPQWDFLDFIAEKAKAYPHFHLIMEGNATGLTEVNGRVTGVIAQTLQSEMTINADLVIGADGRHSVLRDKAGLIVKDEGSPIDVLWFRLPKSPNDPQETLGNFNYGRILVMLDRGDYWQCAFVIRKGTLDAMKTKDFQSFRDDVTKVVPSLKDSLMTLNDWDDVKLLTVTIDHLQRWWKPGLLCIGDAAHAMSPIGGVGINLAIQDAVAAANILTGPLKTKTLRNADLNAIQRRRTLSTWLIQRIQILIQDRMMNRILGSNSPVTPPKIVLLLNRYPFLRRIPARIVGVGFRPEHIRPL